VVADVYDHLRGGYLVRVMMFVFATIAFGVLTAIGTVVMLGQIPRVQGRRLGWLTYPFRVLWDGATFLLLREKMLLHGARAFVEYLRPGFHPSARATDELIPRALDLAHTAGATIGDPPRRGEAA
jgi:predicted metal-dependent hydrolase